ncbi:MAG: hypothetical protein ACFCGT_09695 [Sandaracinaceae bacterium]
MRLVLTLTLALALAACGGPSGEALAPDAARGALIDRNWVSLWPTDPNQRLHVYRFVPSMGGGVYQDRTVFRGSFELFQFEATGQELRFAFPDNQERLHTPYRIERVDGPRPFTHRLTLEQAPRGPAVYYGWNEGQQASPLRDIPQL